MRIQPKRFWLCLFMALTHTDPWNIHAAPVSPRQKSQRALVDPSGGLERLIDAVDVTRVHLELK